MSNVLVFVQQTDGEVAKVSRAAVTAAKQLKDKWGHDKLIGLCVGPSAAAAADKAASLGLDQVFYSEETSFQNYLAIPHAAATEQVAKQNDCKTIVAAATTTGKDFMPRVAAALEAGQASDIIAVNDDGSLKRPMYAGDIFADVEVTTDTKIVTVRSTAFEAAEPSGTAGSTAAISVSVSGPEVKFDNYETSGGDRPELTDAEVVVSGGRALKDETTFMEVMGPLADVFSAAIGASRAAVDSGYAPNDWQVGQTGKIVAPNLYIAVGISGAIQHLAGMKDSKTIVAINKDPDAPIFEIADFGLVADLYEAVPALIEEVKKAKA
ncbi:MAG: electron transfer flavoprotein subunit alpha/FixB family protein [Deltaproteobacteria bacterium]|nr:electron transfer flavoprotein subunit alpha/FixB family protein [Deltaproteobacteria bacterium]